MKRCLLISFIFLFICSGKILAQCSALGQNPSTAFPVCGTTTFHQSTVPICSGQSLAVPGCTSSTATNYANKNPYWYKFTCYVSGSFAFTITPNTASDDYDWQLYDITNRNPNDVFNSASFIVTGNWSGSSGNTGAGPGGVNYIQCASDPAANAPTFAAMPNIVQGHEYLLLISHFTDSQSGYALSFGGGTGSITDPKLPKMESASAPCDGSQIVVRVNKKMNCNSISSGEFLITPSTSNVTSVTGNRCDAGFDFDEFTLNLDTPLPPGNYQVKIKTGEDGNTLLDYCENSIPVDDSIQLIIAPVVPTPMDSLTKPGCSPQTLELVFKKKIRCNSIAANGSDFVINGTYPVTITSAGGVDCVDGLSYKVNVQLSSPLQTAGNFQIRLVQGSDGNTILDECNQQTPPNVYSLPFVIKDTVNANFGTTIFYGCKYDTVQFSHNGLNTVNSWLWNFDNLSSSSLQNPQIIYNTFGNHEVQLMVSNGVCSDTLTKNILLNNTLKAKFDATLLVCPKEQAFFKDLSIANQVVSWSWDFANGNTSNLQNPPPQTYIDRSENYYAPVRLIVEDLIGCKDTAVINLNILNNCYIAVPSAFTPNGDGLNDYLYPVNAYKTTNLRFSIYNRLGQRIFFTQDWNNRWDGKVRGQGADPGTYVWILDYYDLLRNKHVFQKGTTVLIR